MTIVGFSKARCLDHFFSPSTCCHYDRPFRSMAFLTTAMLKTPNSTSHSNQIIQNARIAACLKYFFCWMKDHHIQLNLVKTELLMVSANPSHHHNFSIRLGSSTITPSRTVRNLVVVIDDQLSFTDHIATTARSCRFALYNIRKIRPFLLE